MSRRRCLDAVIVGGGVVGAACALALRRQELDVALVEAVQPPPWQCAAPDLRVYAIAQDSAALLEALGVWDSVHAARAHPYRRMRVSDAAGGGELVFDADRFARSELGWMVEHSLLVEQLWAALADAGVHVHCPARVVALEHGALEQHATERHAENVRLQLDDGLWLQARVAIAADGAGSSVRSLAGIGVAAHDYGQRGVVAYIATEQPHQDTAWQRFLSGGPLAVLPCGDDVSSIVWSLPEAAALSMLDLDDAAFGHALTRAFDARLGAMRTLSTRAAFPLRRQLADEYVAGHVLVLGDAAHVVHPLAGQGVNLGLRDVAALRAMIVAAQGRKGDWCTSPRLARWARQRKSENAIAARAFDAIHRLYTDDGAAATLLRGPLLGLAGKVPAMAQLLWRRASGL